MLVVAGQASSSRFSAGPSLPGAGQSHRLNFGAEDRPPGTELRARPGSAPGEAGLRVCPERRSRGQGQHPTFGPDPAAVPLLPSSPPRGWTGGRREAGGRRAPPPPCGTRGFVLCSGTIDGSGRQGMHLALTWRGRAAPAASPCPEHGDRDAASPAPLHRPLQTGGRCGCGRGGPSPPHEYAWGPRGAVPAGAGGHVGRTAAFQRLAK